MKASSRYTKYDSSLHSLLFAKKLLIIAFVVQLPLIPPFLHVYLLTPGLLGLIVLTSGILSLIAYLKTKREIEEEFLENPSREVRVNSRLTALAAATFWMSFFLPLANLILVIWCFIRANSAINTLVQWRAAEIVKQERADSMKGGVCDAFRIQMEKT